MFAVFENAKLPTSSLPTKGGAGNFFDCLENQVRKNSLNIKFLGGIFLGHPGPRRWDIPDKNFMHVALFCCFRQGVAGMSRDLGRDVPDLENFMQKNFGLIFRTLENQQLTYGVVSEGVFAESLRKFCGISAESSRKLRSIAPGKGAEILRKVCGNFAEICGKFSAMTPSRTTP